eukprot:2744639-Karenia_brevis.AAC.1
MLENWIDWIRRTTSIAEGHLHKIVLDDWVHAARRRKFKFAGHVARREDGRWSTQVSTWIPETGYRQIGRPKRRWRDVLDTFFQRLWGVTIGFWQVPAQDRERWKRLERTFVEQEWEH